MPHITHFTSRGGKLEPSEKKGNHVLFSAKRSQEGKKSDGKADFNANISPLFSVLCTRSLHILFIMFAHNIVKMLFIVIDFHFPSFSLTCLHDLCGNSE